jgi:hypothetical protein
MHLYHKSSPNLDDMRATARYKGGGVMILYDRGNGIILWQQYEGGGDIICDHGGIMYDLGVM